MTKQELAAIKKRIGKNVGRIRKDKGLSFLQVSYNCSLGAGRINEIEHGKHNVTVGTLYELAKGLDVDVIEFLK